MAPRKQRANSPEFPVLEANALYAGEIRGDGELRVLQLIVLTEADFRPRQLPVQRLVRPALRPPRDA
jgi:hypothetical protein